MTRSCGRRWTLPAMILLVCTGIARTEEVTVVTVIGRGITAESARRDALRTALEQGGRVEIASRSEVRDFELIRDTIFARADGIITEYEILRQGEQAGGVHFCEIRAGVSKNAVASTWGEVQNVLEQVGRPAIGVYIFERIDGVEQDSSILESQIEKRLIEKGFSVFARAQFRKILEGESADAFAENDVSKLRRVARQFGTEILITGTAQANAAGVKSLFGEPTAMYNCDAMIKVYDTDTGKLMASESLPNRRGGARGTLEHSPQGGKKALENAGRDLVGRCYEALMKSWATRISAGAELLLEIQGLTVAEALRLKTRISAIDTDKILGVSGPRTVAGITTYRIRAKMTAEDLAHHFAQGEWTPSIELISLKPNHIQARKVVR